MTRLICLVLCLSVMLQLKAGQRIIVSKDGTGNFTTVQQAIDAVKDRQDEVTIIFINNGVYKEKLVVPETKQHIHLLGESVEKTILTYDDFAAKKDSSGKDTGTSGSSSFFLYAPDFTAENITFENSSGPVGQAVAARITGDRAKFINCRFLGFQDTLYTQGSDSRQYYVHCYIEGTVDFIFGFSTAVFDSCIIVGKGGGYFTAASTPQGKAFGYVFRHCDFSAKADAGTFYLGRPWRPFAKTVLLYCNISDVVKPEGWHNWDKASNEATAYYAEYKNKGAGYKPLQRVSWSHQLTDEEAALYTLQNVFGDWYPGP